MAWVPSTGLYNKQGFLSRRGPVFTLMLLRELWVVRHRKVCCGMLAWELTHTDAALGQCSSAYSDTARKKETWSGPCLILPLLFFP